ncbi:MAG: hypothetical protein AAFQ33_10550, partial [Pseudomonadota bacterium]
MSTAALMALVVSFTGPEPVAHDTIAEAHDRDFIIVYCDLANGRKGKWRERLVERQLPLVDYKLLHWSARHMLRTNAIEAATPAMFLARERSVCDRL